MAIPTPILLFLISLPPFFLDRQIPRFIGIASFFVIGLLPGAPDDRSILAFAVGERQFGSVYGSVGFEGQRIEFS
jgi:hypothetical protein